MTPIPSKITISHLAPLRSWTNCQTHPFIPLYLSQIKGRAANLWRTLWDYGVIDAYANFIPDVNVQLPPLDEEEIVILENKLHEPFPVEAFSLSCSEVVDFLEKTLESMQVKIDKKFLDGDFIAYVLFTLTNYGRRTFRDLLKISEEELAFLNLSPFSKARIKTQINITKNSGALDENDLEEIVSQYVRQFYRHFTFDPSNENVRATTVHTGFDCYAILSFQSPPVDIILLEQKASSSFTKDNLFIEWPFSKCHKVQEIQSSSDFLPVECLIHQALGICRLGDETAFNKHLWRDLIIAFTRGLSSAQVTKQSQLLEINLFEGSGLSKLSDDERITGAHDEITHAFTGSASEKFYLLFNFCQFLRGRFSESEIETIFHMTVKEIGMADDAPEIDRLLLSLAKDKNISFQLLQSFLQAGAFYAHLAKLRPNGKNAINVVAHDFSFFLLSLKLGSYSLVFPASHLGALDFLSHEGIEFEKYEAELLKLFYLIYPQQLSMFDLDGPSLWAIDSQTLTHAVDQLSEHDVPFLRYLGILYFCSLPNVSTKTKREFVDSRIVFLKALCASQYVRKTLSLVIGEVPEPDAVDQWIIFLFDKKRKAQKTAFELWQSKTHDLDFNLGLVRFLLDQPKWAHAIFNNLSLEKVDSFEDKKKIIETLTQFWGTIEDNDAWSPYKDVLIAASLLSLENLPANEMTKVEQELKALIHYLLLAPLDKNSKKRLVIQLISKELDKKNEKVDKLYTDVLSEWDSHDEQFYKVFNYAIQLKLLNDETGIKLVLSVARDLIERRKPKDVEKGLNYLKQLMPLWNGSNNEEFARTVKSLINKQISFEKLFDLLVFFAKKIHQSEMTQKESLEVFRLLLKRSLETITQEKEQNKIVELINKNKFALPIFYSIVQQFITDQHELVIPVCSVLEKIKIPREQHPDFKELYDSIYSFVKKSGTTVREQRARSFIRLKLLHKKYYTGKPLEDQFFALYKILVLINYLNFDQITSTISDLEEIYLQFSDIGLTILRSKKNDSDETWSDLGEINALMTVSYLSSNNLDHKATGKKLLLEAKEQKDYPEDYRDHRFSRLFYLFLKKPHAELINSIQQFTSTTLASNPLELFDYGFDWKDIKSMINQLKNFYGSDYEIEAKEIILQLLICNAEIEFANLHAEYPEHDFSNLTNQADLHLPRTTHKDFVKETLIFFVEHYQAKHFLALFETDEYRSYVKPCLVLLLYHPSVFAVNESGKLDWNFFSRICGLITTMAYVNLSEGSTAIGLLWGIIDNFRTQNNLDGEYSRYKKELLTTLQGISTLAYTNQDIQRANFLFHLSEHYLSLLEQDALFYKHSLNQLKNQYILIRDNFVDTTKPILSTLANAIDPRTDSLEKVESELQAESKRMLQQLKNWKKKSAKQKKQITQEFLENRKLNYSLKFEVLDSLIEVKESIDQGIYEIALMLCKDASINNPTPLVEWLEKTSFWTSLVQTVQKDFDIFFFDMMKTLMKNPVYHKLIVRAFSLVNHINFSNDEMFCSLYEDVVLFLFDYQDEQQSQQSAFIRNEALHERCYKQDTEASVILLTNAFVICSVLLPAHIDQDLISFGEKFYNNLVDLCDRFNKENKDKGLFTLIKRAQIDATLTYLYLGCDNTDIQKKGLDFIKKKADKSTSFAECYIYLWSLEQTLENLSIDLSDQKYSETNKQLNAMRITYEIMLASPKFGEFLDVLNKSQTRQLNSLAIRLLLHEMKREKGNIDFDKCWQRCSILIKSLKDAAANKEIRDNIADALRDFGKILWKKLEVNFDFKKETDFGSELLRNQKHVYLYTCESLLFCIKHGYVYMSEGHRDLFEFCFRPCLALCLKNAMAFSKNSKNEFNNALFSKLTQVIGGFAVAFPEDGFMAADLYCESLSLFLKNKIMNREKYVSCKFELTQYLFASLLNHRGNRSGGMTDKAFHIPLMHSYLDQAVRDEDFKDKNISPALSFITQLGQLEQKLSKTQGQSPRDKSQ